LRKDFTVSENDVLDAAEAGAGLVLLIATILSDDQLLRFDRLASDLGLMSLFEVHDETELRRVEAVGAHLIGVNQRDLHSFTIDPTRAARVRQSARTSAHFVCESGLRSVQDIAQAAANGFDAVLIGETLMRAGDQLPELLQAMSTIRKI
jgi:indole-3-glycerol phosphate synthase